jgi:hypothetical protein
VEKGARRCGGWRLPSSFSPSQLHPGAGRLPSAEGQSARLGRVQPLITKLQVLRSPNSELDLFYGDPYLAGEPMSGGHWARPNLMSNFGILCAALYTTEPWLGGGAKGNCLCNSVAESAEELFMRERGKGKGENDIGYMTSDVSYDVLSTSIDVRCHPYLFGVVFGVRFFFVGKWQRARKWQ